MVNLYVYIRKRSSGEPGQRIERSFCDLSPLPEAVPETAPEKAEHEE
jgi:hypothetical protein